MKVAIAIFVIAHLVASMWHGNAHSTLGVCLATQPTMFVYINGTFRDAPSFAMGRR